MNQLKHMFLCLMLSGASLMAATTPPYATSSIPQGRYALQQPGDTNPAVIADEYVAFLNQKGKKDLDVGFWGLCMGETPHYNDPAMMGSQGCITRSGNNGNYVYSVNNGKNNQIITSVSSSYAATQFQAWRKNPTIADLRDYITAQFQLQYAAQNGTPNSNPIDLSNFDFIIGQYYPVFQEQRSADNDYATIVNDIKQRYASYHGGIFNQADEIVSYLVGTLPLCTPSDAVAYVAISSPDTTMIADSSSDLVRNLSSFNNGVWMGTIITIPTFYYSDLIAKSNDATTSSSFFNNLTYYPNGPIRPFVIPAEKVAAYSLYPGSDFYRLSSPMRAQVGSLNVNWNAAAPFSSNLFNQNFLFDASNFYTDAYQLNAGWLF